MPQHVDILRFPISDVLYVVADGQFCVGFIGKLSYCCVVKNRSVPWTKYAFILSVYDSHIELRPYV